MHECVGGKGRLKSEPGRIGETHIVVREFENEIKIRILPGRVGREEPRVLRLKFVLFYSAITLSIKNSFRFLACGFRFFGNHARNNRKVSGVSGRTNFTIFPGSALTEIRITRVGNSFDVWMIKLFFSD